SPTVAGPEDSFRRHVTTFCLPKATLAPPRNRQHNQRTGRYGTGLQPGNRGRSSIDLPRELDRIAGGEWNLFSTAIAFKSAAKDLLLPHLPYLRRYARALTGSQRRGDTYVAATIESILAEVTRDELASNPKILLFRSFHDVWQRLAPPPVAEGGEA